MPDDLLPPYSSAKDRRQDDLFSAQLLTRGLPDYNFVGGAYQEYQAGTRPGSRVFFCPVPKTTSVFGIIPATMYNIVAPLLPATLCCGTGLDVLAVNHDEGRAIAVG